MSFVFEEAFPASPYVERFWRTESHHDGAFTSTASSRWGMVVMKHQGRETLFVRGPETRATPADFPAEAEWFGIDFKLGAFMPGIPPVAVRDRNDLALPSGCFHTFWLDGAVWRLPDFDNADAFVARLVRDGLLVRDSVVDAALAGSAAGISRRSVQSRFLRATGLTLTGVRQIERARQAASLIEQGVPILDAVHESGYFDQPHLTRALKRFYGRTPREIALGAAP